MWFYDAQILYLLYGNYWILYNFAKNNFYKFTTLFLYFWYYWEKNYEWDFLELIS